MQNYSDFKSTMDNNPNEVLFKKNMPRVSNVTSITEPNLSHSPIRRLDCDTNRSNKKTGKLKMITKHIPKTYKKSYSHINKQWSSICPNEEDIEYDKVQCSEIKKLQTEESINRNKDLKQQKILKNNAEDFTRRRHKSAETHKKIQHKIRKRHSICTDEYMENDRINPEEGIPIENKKSQLLNKKQSKISTIKKNKNVDKKHLSYEHKQKYSAYGMSKDKNNSNTGKALKFVTSNHKYGDIKTNFKPSEQKTSIIIEQHGDGLKLIILGKGECQERMFYGQTKFKNGNNLNAVEGSSEKLIHAEVWPSNVNETEIYNIETL